MATSIRQGPRSPASSSAQAPRGLPLARRPRPTRQTAAPLKIGNMHKSRRPKSDAHPAASKIGLPRPQQEQPLSFCFLDRCTRALAAFFVLSDDRRHRTTMGLFQRVRSICLPARRLMHALDLAGLVVGAIWPIHGPFSAICQPPLFVGIFYITIHCVRIVEDWVYGHDEDVVRDRASGFFFAAALEPALVTTSSSGIVGFVTGRKYD